MCIIRRRFQDPLHKRSCSNLKTDHQSVNTKVQMREELAENNKKEQCVHQVFVDPLKKSYTWVSHDPWYVHLHFICRAVWTQVGRLKIVQPKLTLTLPENRSN